MEIEEDNIIPFLDTTASRDSDGLLTNTVYRKPTHTDQYLAYDSHHLQSVKRVIVSSRTQHLGLTRYDLKTPWNHQNKTVSFKRSHVNAAKCISVKQGDQCEK